MWLNDKMPPQEAFAMLQPRFMGQGVTWDVVTPEDVTFMRKYINEYREISVYSDEDEKRLLSSFSRWSTNSGSPPVVSVDEKKEPQSPEATND